MTPIRELASPACISLASEIAIAIVGGSYSSRHTQCPRVLEMTSLGIMHMQAFRVNSGSMGQQIVVTHTPSFDNVPYRPMHVEFQTSHLLRCAVVLPS